MWFGLLYPAAADARDGTAVVGAYEPHRVFTVGAPLPALPQILRLLHRAACETGGVEHPICRSCGCPLDVPPLEGDAGCASA